jgi:Ca2+-binding RTX toxin-like protein
LSGSDFNDVLSGDAEPLNLLFGEAGNDELDGRDGFDVLIGGLDDDLCMNGEQNEECEKESLAAAFALQAPVARQAAPPATGLGALGAALNRADAIMNATESDPMPPRMGPR